MGTLDSAIDQEIMDVNGMLPVTFKNLAPAPSYMAVNLGSSLGSGLNSGSSLNLGNLNNFNSPYTTRTFPSTLGGGAGNNTFDVGGGNGGGAYNLSTFGKVNAGLQTLGNMMSAWNGYQQTKVAKQQLAFQKDSFNKQYSAQKNLTNSQLEDRQRRRFNEATANGYNNQMSVNEYMDKYGIK